MRELLIKTCLSVVPSSIANMLTSDFTPVFMLHRIVDSNGELDQSHVQRLHEFLGYVRNNNYHPISLEDLFKCMAECRPLPQRSVAFTVDDGFADQFAHLVPIFNQYDIPLTFFVITGFLDGDLWPWDDQIDYVISHTRRKTLPLLLPDGESSDYSLNGGSEQQLVETLRNRLKLCDQENLYDWLSHLYGVAEVDVPVETPEEYRAASWQQAIDCVAQGHAIAAHTRTHRILSRLSDNEARDEILGSYQYLKSKVPQSVDVFAYPTGRVIDFGAREQAIIRESAMLGAVSAVPDSMRSGYNIEAVPRYGLPENLADFLQYLSFIEVLKTRVRKNTPVS